MRIDALAVRNFRGIRRAEISGLADHPLVTVSGRNGSGKSLVLEAIGLLWRADRLPSGLQPQFLLGSWGDQVHLEMTVSFTAVERTGFDELAARMGVVVPPMPDRAVIRTDVGPSIGNAFYADQWLNVLRSIPYASELPFGQIDHLPADRQTGRGEQAQVNPALLKDDQREQLRTQIVGSYAQQRQVVGISGIAPLLATADYMDLLAHREKRPPSGDFAAITDPFTTATGKRILPPTADPASPYGATLRVETPADTSHTLDQLSSGEQEVLNLAFFIRRLSARGGVVLIDEPELHLHPALQRSLFAQFEELTDRAQIWIVTHSPRIVTAASLPAVLHMRAATQEDVNQLRRASDESDRASLLDDLGVHPIEVLQSQFLIVVEGSSDETRLEALLPVEVSPAIFATAGNAEAVEKACRSLSSAPGLHFVAVRDRDLLTDDNVARLLERCPQMFVWPARCLENEFLDDRLLSKTLERLGRPRTRAQVAADLRTLADGHKADVLADLVETALKERHEVARRGSTRLERLRSYLQETERIAAEKLAEFDQVCSDATSQLDARWEQDYIKLMDGKRALGEFASLVRLSVPDLISAIVATLRDHPDLLPYGLSLFQRRLTDLAMSTRAETADPPPD